MILDFFVLPSDYLIIIWKFTFAYNRVVVDDEKFGKSFNFKNGNLENLENQIVDIENRN